MVELAMPAPIVVDLVPHSPDWAAAAEREMQRIAAALPGIVLKTHHIGSTSIPGILRETNSRSNAGGSQPREFGCGTGANYCTGILLVGRVRNSRPPLLQLR